MVGAMDLPRSLTFMPRQICRSLRTRIFTALTIRLTSR